MDDFEFVHQHMSMNATDIEECKQEAREHQAWALGYYPWAAAMLRGREGDQRTRLPEC